MKFLCQLEHDAQAKKVHHELFLYKVPEDSQEMGAVLSEISGERFNKGEHKS